MSIEEIVSEFQNNILTRCSKYGKSPSEFRKGLLVEIQLAREE